MRKIELVKDVHWGDRFKEEADALASALGGLFYELHHFGSTAIPGLAAKPVIDMLLVVDDLSPLDEREKAFSTLGYVPMGEYGIPRRRFFTKGGDARTHHLHAYERTNTVEISRHLNFRDYLRAHPETAKEYETLKYELVERYGSSPEEYCEAKTSFIQQIEAEAVA